MRSILLLLLLLLLKAPVVTSAHLVERQTQELWNPVDTIKATFTFLGGVGAYIGENLFQDPRESDTSKTISPPNENTQSDGQTPPDSLKAQPASPPASATSSPAEPVYKVNINNDQSPNISPNLQGIHPLVNEECDINDPYCGKTTDQLVFTSSCIGINPKKAVSDEARAQNQAIQAALDRMNSQNSLAGVGGLGLRTSMSKICDVYFWAVPLTESQVQEIEKMPNVDMVRPNQDLHKDQKSSGLGENRPAEEPTFPAPAFAAPGSRLKERDQLVVDRFAWDDLRFISTPPNLPLSKTYSYYSKAGDKVINIAVDTGVNILHDEFRTETGQRSILENPIYAMDTDNVPGGIDDTGTCRTSKIVGRTVGVARRAKVMLAKVSYKMSSVVSILMKILDYLNAKEDNGENLRGYHVMSMMIPWNNDDQKILDRLDQLFDVLINYFQLVVVVPAGLDLEYHNGDINEWPANTAGRFNVIVVGAVEVATGETYSYSRGGEFLSVNAPGDVRCAFEYDLDGSEYTNWMGNDVAATLVAGVISYLLSGEETGPYLRRDPATISYMVKQYIENVASYKRRDDGFPAIWNLFGAKSIYLDAEPEPN